MSHSEDKYNYVINYVLQGYDRETVENHVSELESDLNFALNMSKKRGDEILQLEKEKAELIWMFQDLLLAAIDFYKYYPNNFRATAKKYFFEDIELLKKHGVEI